MDKLSVEEKKKEEEFHLSRAAFAIIPEPPDFELVHIAKDKRGHKEWLMDDYDLDEEGFENSVRGYITKDYAVFYKGSDFKSLNSEELDSIFEYYDFIFNLASYYFKVDKLDIYNGVIIGDIGSVWKPRDFICRIFTSEGYSKHSIDICGIQGPLFHSDMSVISPNGVKFKSFNDLYMYISEVAEKDKKTFEQIYIKFSEESGELAEAILSSQDVCACGYKGKTKDDIKEELADSIVCLLNMSARSGISADELINTIGLKALKWDNNLKQVEK